MVKSDDQKKEIIGSIYKLLASESIENIDESYEKCISEAERDLEVEFPVDVKPILRSFFLKGYRTSEQNNIKILKLISELKE